MGQEKAVLGFGHSGDDLFFAHLDMTSCPISGVKEECAVSMIHTKKRSKVFLRGKFGCTDPAAKIKPPLSIIHFLLAGWKALRLKAGGERKGLLLDLSWAPTHQLVLF